MSQTRRITVKIAGKDYAMTVPVDKEEQFRRAAREINGLISEYRSSYAAEPEDYLAMAALQMAFEKVDLEMERSLSDEMETISELNLKIDAYLNEAGK